MAVTATLTIDYEKATDDALINAELDSDYNNDKSTFAIDDEAYYQVYSNIEYSQATSDGSISDEGSGSDEKEETHELTSADDLIVETSYPINSDITINWVGGVASASDFEVIGGNGSNKIKCNNNNVGKENPVVFKVSYTSNFNRHKLSAPGSFPSGAEQYKIVIVVYADPS